jgi:hypothetical protein
MMTLNESGQFLPGVTLSSDMVGLWIELNHYELRINPDFTYSPLADLKNDFFWR